MVVKNKIKSMLLDGKEVIGTWMVTPSSTNAEIFSKAGMDFIIIDLEHGPVSYETAQNMIRSAELHNTTPLLRVPTCSQSEILRGLEIGSHGIVVPNIETKDQASSVINYLKYSPSGNRGVSAFTRSSGFNAIGKKDRTNFANQQLLSVILVESLSAIKNIDSILTLPEIDVVYIGTYDLSQSLGQTDSLYSKEMINILEKTVRKIRDSGKAAGALSQSSNDTKNWINMGMQFIPYLVDCGIIFDGAKNIVNDFKSIRN